MDPRAPQSGFSRLIRRIRSRTSRGTGGRPLLVRRDFQVPNRRKPFRCQPMTVSGFTMTSTSRQFGRSRESNTQSSRSDGRSDGRGDILFIVASWCRRARSSSWSTARPRKVSRSTDRRGRRTIACMPARLPSHGRKGQSSCSRRGFQEGQGAEVGCCSAYAHACDQNFWSS